MVRILLIAFIAIFISSDALVAQQQRRGRFFQNLFGGGQKAPTQNDAFLQQQQAQKLQQQQYQQRLQQQQKLQQQKLQQSRTPTPLRSTNQSTAGRSPTPLNNSPASRTPYQAGRTPTPKSSPATIYNQQKSASYRPKSSTPKTGNRKGFGFRITDNDKDQLIVTSVDRSGNAAEAGLARGDQVTEIGGIEANSAEEFDEIAKIMGEGDQMDFKIRRGGRAVSYTHLTLPTKA